MQKATAQQLKEHNQQLVLKAIYTGQANSRAAIAEQTSLTRPTVSQIVGELLAAGLVQEEGQGESSGGKPPTILGFVDDAYQVIGLHLGGHRTFGAVTDLRGQILARAARPTDRTDVESVLTGLALTLDNLRAQATRPLLGIGVSVPGLVDPRNGVVRYTAYLNWQDVPLGQRLAAHCDDIPVYLDNDTNLAALGERVFGAGGGIDNMVIVMVGVAGIGAGIVVNGEIYHGAGGGAGEIGHMPIANNDVPCVCGRRGCLEAVSSGWALVRQAREIAAAHPDSALNTLAPDDITFDDVQQAVKAGDKAAVTLALDAGHYLGLMVAILSSTVNPQRIIIGGSVSELGEPLFDSLRRTAVEHTLAILADETEILPASLGTDVNILGAAAQVLKGELGVV
ncbi:MAG: ROK family transcriptional regulator [Chloroflexota bacterium]|nr:ROK family transcriptional regulator [Chloroflexota bacterium]